MFSRRMHRCAVLALTVAMLALTSGALGAPGARAAAPACPSDLSAWKVALHAAWLDCHRVDDLLVYAPSLGDNNPWTDQNNLTGMGPTPTSGGAPAADGSGSSGALNSKYTQPEPKAVPGLQLDGWFGDPSSGKPEDGCNAFQAEPDLSNKSGASWIPGCTPPTTSGQTCVSQCHQDGQFVLRIPDGWNGHLETAGTPGIRDQYSSDLVLSDDAVERGWAYVSQDKGNMGADFYRDSTNETGCSTPWCPAVAIQEWTTKMREATRAARRLLDQIGPSLYDVPGVTRSYAVGISNGGYQTRRALETDTPADRLYDGGVDWEGTLFSNAENLFSYLPTALAQWPGDTSDSASAVAALSAVGFNPESQPLWNYHWAIYWGLTQKIYRLEFDPEYTGYTCSSTAGAGSPCVSPPAEAVQPSDPDAAYSYGARLKALPALAARMNSVANTGQIHAPLITLQGDQDSLLPIRTDSDLYSRMVLAAGHGGIYRFYTVRGGNHVDPQYDDHSSDSYGQTLLRPMLPCVRDAVTALAAWVEHSSPPPLSHTIPRDPNATPDQLANQCSLAAGAPAPPPGIERPGRSRPWIRVIRRVETVAGRLALIRVSCVGARSCSGLVALRLLLPRAHRRPGLRKSHVVASKRITVGKGVVVKLALDRQAMRQLRRARHNRLPALAITYTVTGKRTQVRILLELVRS